jgi:hypothetical protein
MNRSHVYLVVASVALSGAAITSANAVNWNGEGPYYSDTIHQSAGDRDSRGTPKYYGGARGARPGARLNSAHWNKMGAGPYYSDTIHQSAGDRDSRGTPKYVERPGFGGSYNSVGPAVPPVGVEPDFQLEGR